MDEVIGLFNKNNVRYLLIGGQAVRLEGMPRFSMDWGFYIPPKDLANIKKINSLLNGELDLRLEPLGRKGENFIQTFQTKWGILQFHLGGPGLPDFDQAEKRAVTHKTETDVAVRCICGTDLLESKKRTKQAGRQNRYRISGKEKRTGPALNCR